MKNEQSGVNTGAVRIKAEYLIGVDPGTKTGFALYNRTRKDLITVRTLSAHAAWENVRTMKAIYGADKIHVRFEDCRLRKWFGKAGPERLKGVGSVERDCSLWEDFLEREGISYDKVAPKNTKTKVPAAYFKKLTNWPLTSSEHSRDAAMLVYGF